jgi:hypothetical protein
MSSYTITITPDDTTRASTTLRVDVSDNAARITELLVRAGAAAGLSARQLPAVDLDLLLRAVNPAVPTSIPAAVTESADTPGESPPPRARARAGRATSARATSARTTSARGGRRGAGKQAEPKAAKRGGGRAARATKKSAAKAAAGGERAYRRAPADLVQVFGELGGATAVARHYQVPRYTAQSWIRRLRNEGQLPAAE